MAFQFQILGNDLYITDDQTGIIQFQEAAKECSFDNSELNKGNIYITYPLVSNESASTKFRIAIGADAVDSQGTPFTEETFRTFCSDNLGGAGSDGSFEPKDYSTEVALGNITDTSIVNKFGFNADIDSGSGFEIIASFGGSFDPLTQVITTLQTFTILYDETVDGLGTSGALGILISIIDENFEQVDQFHTLGNTGSDVTSFSGYGINRALVFSNGGDGFNAQDITIEATIDSTIQAQIPSQSSVTQQCVYQTPVGFSFLMDFIEISALKLSGGGGSPKINIKGYSYSRVTNTIYDIFDQQIDTDVENNIPISFPKPFIFGGREVIYFVADTDVNNTKVSLRFSGLITK